MNFEEYKEGLSEEKRELFEAREASDRETYEKVVELTNDVMNDPKALLPYLPLFYRRVSFKQEKSKLDSYIPRLHAARTEQFCIDVCRNQSQDCFQPCKDFASRAFEAGAELFRAIHKPYQHCSFADDEED